MYGYICEHCGAHLDPGEHCDCEVEKGATANCTRGITRTYLNT